MTPAIIDEEFLQLLEAYKQYEEETMNDVHGETAQYCMIYIKLVNYYLMLNSSIRTADFELFKYILPKIGNLFLFSINLRGNITLEPQF